MVQNKISLPHLRKMTKEDSQTPIDRSSPHWWENVPPNTALPVIVTEKTGQAGQVKKFIEAQNEEFANLSLAQDPTLENLGILSFVLTPVQCSVLMNSGFVESIIYNQQITSRE